MINYDVCVCFLELFFYLLLYSEKVVPTIRNLRINSVSTMYYKVVITTMKK